MSELVELDLSLQELWRRKWLVLAGALLVAGITAGVTLTTPAKYSTTALVEVGRVMGDELEDAFAVAQTINSPGFQTAARKRASGAGSGSVLAEALTGGQGRIEHPTLVRVTATATSAQDAVALGTAAADELAARHHERFDDAVRGYREYENVLAATGETSSNGAVDPVARKELFELRAKLASPVFTEATHLKDPFPLATPQPRNALLSAAVAFVVSLAVLVLLVVALAQVKTPRP